jgi:UDP-2,3-diacylglucosamine pyrophosphatase LpxH
MWDYLLVSDLHLALGFDPERRAYHAREDFFFDAAFFRWLRWADEHCAEGRRWELVFVGDIFDFLPVDDDVVTAYFQALERRSGPEAQYWQQQFSAEPPARSIDARVQRLLFEHDVLAGRVAAASLAPDEPRAAATPAPLPGWAGEIYARYHPEYAAGEHPLFIQPAGGVRAFGAEEAAPPADRPKDAAQRRKDAFERKYGFLPTPEKSADKATAIYEGHPLFFRALAWFVGRGHRLVFVRGNHDLELFWPSVQERLREAIAQEYAASFDDGVPHPLPPGFHERINFNSGWFHYRKGILYAEHGKQYEPLNSVPNPIRPVIPGDECLLSPPVGSLGVTCFHNVLEDAFPEWENRGDHAVVLLELIRRFPFKVTATLVRHGPDFLRMSQRLWAAGKKTDQRPTDEDFAKQASQIGLDQDVVEAIYEELDSPLLTRKFLAWFLFSPMGHVLKISLLLLLAVLVIAVGVLWYLVLAPSMANLIPDDLLSTAAGSALQLLVKVILWLVPPVVFELGRRFMEKRYPEPFLRGAAKRIHRHLGVADPNLHFYIFGHDHKPDVRFVERRDDGRHVYYLNTGSWTPWFAEGERRLQTLGQEVQFTFARLVKGEQGYEADLLRWNDDAGRAERQMTPLA